MSTIKDVFYEMPCLTESSPIINGQVIRRKWFKYADKRHIGQYLYKFIQYNHSALSFLGVTPSIIGSDQNIGISFRTTEFIGAIPLRAPDTGKQIGDFIVSPRFIGKDRYTDYIEILNVLDAEINPSFIDSLPLTSGRNYRPPDYLEAIKFIESLEALLKMKWNKFDVSTKYSSNPSGQIKWKQYIDNSYKVEQTIKFPTRKNILHEKHIEYSQIRYVFDLSKDILKSTNTPQSIKLTISNRLDSITEKLHFLNPIETSNIQIRAFDNPSVKKCKEHANKILNKLVSESTAWRVDYSDVFEKLVQRVFIESTKLIGGRLLCNQKIKSQLNNKYSWELKYLEPDAIFQKGNNIFYIDAKYKSHLFNKYDQSRTLKEDHRKDLHQIIAYSSFNILLNKVSFLCFPSNRIEIKDTTYINSLNNSNITIKLVGIPIKKDYLEDAAKMIASEINNIVRTN
ncbi:MAG: hypothetical protein K9H64_04120 [Bacteroidales bacterium]|nr:hypothetical protein [Bacteroidales bacterium]MCF8455046.1 hypothetical protein [Bacteroidales bacterium]